MIRAIIVDDEPAGREMLEVMIRRYADGLEVVQSCADATAALKAIRELHPDVVFLDIEMPGMNAFEMLEHLPEINFEIIFVTAHNHYAIRAFEFSAFAYLLKPVNKNKFSEVIQKLMQKKSSADQKQQLELLLSQLRQPQAIPEKIAVPSSDGLIFFTINSIIRCEADKNYTLLILTDKRKELVSKPLIEFEKMLQAYGFIRVHRSHLINVKYIDRYIRTGGGHLIMSDQAAIDISPLHKEEFLKRVFKI